MTVLKWLVDCRCRGYLGGLAVLFFAQRSFIFPIPQTERTPPQAAGFPRSRRTCPDHGGWREGHRLARAGKAGPRRSILYFPGNGDFLAGSVGRFRDMTRDGTGLVALSYRGYAGSSGQPSEQGLLRDAAAAYAFTAARYSADRIVVWGFSLGTRRRGRAGGRAAGRKADPGSALHLDRRMLPPRLFRFAPVRWLMRDQFRSDQRIARVTAPLLIMHGARDPTIPIALWRAPVRARP